MCYRHAKLCTLTCAFRCPTVAALSRLLASMSPEDRAELEALAREVLQDLDLAFEVDRLAGALAERFADLPWDDPALGGGEEPMPMQATVDALERLSDYEDLDRAMRADYAGATLEDIDEERLRRTLGEDRVVTQPPGYRFRLEQGELDLHRFEQLVQEGRTNGDAKVLRDALAIWRGGALANLRDEPFAQHAAHRLEEARLSVLEDRIDADLAAGGGAVLVPELEQLIAREPLRERLYGQLMLALYRDGRQADALETYQRARKLLSARAD